MFRMSQLVSLILAFCLGFSCCGGVLIGGAAIALSSFRVRDLEKHEILDIPDEMFLEENPNVDLLNLTAFEMINEMKKLYALGDQVSIAYLQSEYGIKIPSAADQFLTDDAKNMPVSVLFSEEGVQNLLSKLYIGYVQGFKCYEKGTEIEGDPALGKDVVEWYNPTTDKVITGINETLAFISLGDFVSGKVDVTAIIGGLHIGDALGYYSEVDPDTGDEVWYDGTSGKPVHGIMGVFAGCTVDTIDDTIDTVTIGDLLNMEKIDGSWYEYNEATQQYDKKVVGIITVFADCTMNDISSKLDTATIGELLGYDLRDGVYYEQDSVTGEYSVKVSGLMGYLAPTPINGVGEKINEARVGNLLGYEEIGGKWYEQDPVTGKYTVKVSGLMGALAPSKITEVSKTINETELGILLGYEEIGGKWYEYNDVSGEYDIPTSGIMSVLAPSYITNVADTVNKTELGSLLGYDKIGEKWYNGDEPVTGFMAKIASSRLVADENGNGAIGDVFETLTIGDIVDEEDRKGGIFAILDPNTPITGIAGAIDGSIKESPLQFFINEKLISFGDDAQKSLDDISKLYGGQHMTAISKDDPNYNKYYNIEGKTWETSGNYYLIPTWRTKPLVDSFGYIVELLSTPKIPSIPPIPYAE